MKSLEKGKGELSDKLENQKEMVISKMAEIEVLKEWDKVSVAHAGLSAVYFHVELSKMSEEEAVEGEGLLSRVGAACWRMSAVRSGKRVVRGSSSVLIGSAAMEEEVDLEGSLQAYQILQQGMENPEQFLNMFMQREAEPFHQQHMFGDIDFDVID